MNGSENPQISIVAPLYNESKSFSFLIDRLNKLIENSRYSIEVVLVNDGSSDNTGDLMYQLGLSNNNYQCIFLSRNYGHQIALSAALQNVRATEAIFVIDGDLQDPPELLHDFYNKYKEGYDVVYGVRKKRKEGLLKKLCYHLYYRMQKKVSNVQIPLDSGDFCLISRKIVDILNKMPERSRYIRGMRSWIGFRQTGIEYERKERVAGNSQYTWKMLFNLAFNGIFNFSEFPVKFITRLGIMSILISLIYFFYVLYSKFFLQGVPSGFTGLLFAIILFGGVQLICIGVLGEYIIRIFFQVKERPLYIIKEKIVNKEIKD